MHKLLINSTHPGAIFTKKKIPADFHCTGDWHYPNKKPRFHCHVCVFVYSSGGFCQTRNGYWMDLHDWDAAQQNHFSFCPDPDGRTDPIMSYRRLVVVFLFNACYWGNTDQQHDAIQASSRLVSADWELFGADLIKKKSSQSDSLYGAGGESLDFIGFFNKPPTVAHSKCMKKSRWCWMNWSQIVY